MTKWGTETTLRFIQEYGKRSCLWDHGNYNYKNKRLRLEALKEIIEQMQLDNFTVKDAKDKIHGLRATYISERKKLLEANGRGYQPKLVWYPVADSFLKNVINVKANNDSVIVSINSK